MSETDKTKNGTIKGYEFRGFTISSHMLYHLRHYIEHRQPVGHFLTAILTNDLSGAVARADEKNIANLPAYIGYLYNCAPSKCWGSVEKVEKWLAGESDLKNRKATK